MRRRMLPVLALCAAWLLPPVSHAQGIPVMDIANLIQDILQVINEIEQIDNEVQSLSNEAQSLETEASNLKHLHFNVLSRLDQTTIRIDQLLHQAQGLAFDVSQ